MRAAIVFNIFFDYGQFIKYVDEGEIDEEYDYKGALEVLNQQVKELVDKEELTILYNHRRCKIRLPIKEYECGIIDESKERGPYWSQVEIWCESNHNVCDFYWEKLTVGKHPDWFVPVGKCIKQNPFQIPNNSKY